MRQVFLFMIHALCISAQGQDNLEWDGQYQLQLSDFRSPATQIGGTGMYSLHSGSSMDFSYSMSRAEFMFTKNFNPKVNCSFNRAAASIVAPDSSIAMDLLRFSRYAFDLAELYARKFRKQLFEAKGVLSDEDFFKPAFERAQREFEERHALAGKLTDLGRNREKLQELHREVLKEVEQLSGFCKTCKPPKTNTQ